MSKMDDDIEAALLPNDHGAETTATSVATSTNDVEHEDPPKQMGMWDYIHTGVSGILSVGGVATAAGASVTSPGIAIWAASGFSAFNSPSIIYKQMKLSKAPGVRAQITLLKKDTNLLAKENDVLKESIDALEDEVEDIKEIEDNLQSITERQGQNVNEFVRLVKENEEILKGMRQYVVKLAIEDVTNIVVTADRDGDMTIDERELHRLTLQIETKLDAHGIKMNADKFEARISKDPSITNVLHVCKSFLQNDAAVGDEDDDDSDDDSTDSSSTVEYGEDDSSDDESEDSDEEDVMFTLDEKYTAGTRMSVKGPSRKNRVTKIMKKTKKLATASSMDFD